MSEALLCCEDHPAELGGLQLSMALLGTSGALGQALLERSVLSAVPLVGAELPLLAATQAADGRKGLDDVLLVLRSVRRRGQLVPPRWAAARAAVLRAGGPRHPRMKAKQKAEDVSAELEPIKIM